MAEKMMAAEEKKDGVSKISVKSFAIAKPNLT